MHVVGGLAIAVDGELAPEPPVRSSSSAPEIVLRLQSARAPSASLRPGAAAALERDSWAAFVDGDTVTLCTRDAGREVTRIELERDGLRGRYFAENELPWCYVYPTDQLLVIHALGVAGGALMHGAAIAGRDGALLCCGPSGTGKTTMSRAAALLGGRVLSDERTIVRPDAGRGGAGWLLGGTPWPGEGGFADNASLPLRGLVLLEQADRNELLPLSPARALALLYRCHFPPAWDARAAERTLDHLARLVREVPALLFRNVKGADAARLLLDRVGGVA